MGERKYLTLEQASAILQIPVETLRKKIRKGQLQAYKPGKLVMIEMKDLELFVKRSRVGHAS